MISIFDVAKHYRLGKKRWGKGVKKRSEEGDMLSCWLQAKLLQLGARGRFLLGNAFHKMKVILQAWKDKAIASY